MYSADKLFSIKDEIIIRQQLVEQQIPYSTTIEGMHQILLAIEAVQSNELEVKSIQEYHK